MDSSAKTVACRPRVCPFYRNNDSRQSKDDVTLTGIRNVAHAKYDHKGRGRFGNQRRGVVRHMRCVGRLNFTRTHRTLSTTSIFGQSRDFNAFRCLNDFMTVFQAEKQHPQGDISTVLRLLSVT